MYSTTLNAETIRSLVEARHADPFSILGPHRVPGEPPKVAIRALLPDVDSVEVRLLDGRLPRDHAMKKIEEGFFELLLDGDRIPRYRLVGRRRGGETWEFEDPYRFPPILGSLDIHLLSEGTHLRSFEKLGAHLIELEGVRGVHFGVWAPNAERVSVVGAFNNWDGRRHPMRYHGSSGVWEVFIPGLVEGEFYKYEIRSRAGDLRMKADPYGFRFEYRPGTASVVHDIDRYEWRDAGWLEERRRRNWLESPMCIYEVHLGSWRRVPGDGNRFLTYRELAHELGDYVCEMGFTHIELLPVQEHPFDGSWGYQPIGYFAPTSRFGTPDDFMYFVDHLHSRGIGVILDWVPAHFPRDDHGLRYFDGSHLYEHADPRQGEHLDWGTMIFNYGRREVQNFLLGSALFWIEKMHIDGIRVDAVASMIYLDYSRPVGQWIPNEYGGNENLQAIDFLKRFNCVCHEQHPGVLTIAEESTAFSGVSKPTYLGGLGFSMKWNMGWMNDTLYYFEREPVHRKYHHQNLTFSLLYAFSENFVLPLSHDEVVHGKRSLLDKMPGDGWQKFANLRLLLGFQYAHPGKKLLFQGCEFGHGREWDFDHSLDWHLLDIDYHRRLRDFVRDLNRLYRSERALHEVDFDWTGFEWVDFRDWEQSVIAFVRRAREGQEELLVALNFTPVPRGGYRLGVGTGGFYRELLNSDAACYGGSGMGNLGGVIAQERQAHGKPFSVELTLPPLGIVILKWDGAAPGS